jgi:flavin reductase (DIM6/NTAB) family NADH-FMN oxidoreductase RutF
MAIDAARFRQIFGHFATGVTVITTAHEGWLHGMTANAITSVSLDPLLLLICVDQTAHTHGQLTNAGRFAVNILGEDQEDLSRLFANTQEPERDSLRGASYHFGVHGAPVLDKCLAYLECEVADRCEGGDHTIFIGSVLEGDLVQEAAPLIFYRGGYRRLGG